MTYTELMTNRAEYFYELIGPFLARREIERELRAPIWDDDGREWRAALDGGVIGFASRIYRPQHRRVEIASVFVNPEWRRRGIGRTLVAALMVPGVRTRVVATPVSVELYRSLGFTARAPRGKFLVMEHADGKATPASHIG